MKYFILPILLFSPVYWVHGDELVFGECVRRGSTRVSLMKVIIDPNSCLNERISVGGHLVLGNSESMLYFSKEAMDSIDVGNAVILKVDGLLSFLEDSKRIPYTTLVYVQGFVKYAPQIKNAERRIWIEPECVVFLVE